MSENNPQVQFWNHVFFASEAIATAAPHEARATALAQLVTLTEAFGEQSDPVENFESYVVLQLCGVLQACLQPEPPAV